MPSTPFLQLAIQILTAYTTTFLPHCKDSLCSLSHRLCTIPYLLQAKKSLFPQWKQGFSVYYQSLFRFGQSRCGLLWGLPSRSVSTPRPSGTATRPVMKLSPVRNRRSATPEGQSEAPQNSRALLSARRQISMPMKSSGTPEKQRSPRHRRATARRQAAALCALSSAARRESPASTAKPCRRLWHSRRKPRRNTWSRAFPIGGEPQQNERHSRRGDSSAQR